MPHHDSQTQLPWTKIAVLAGGLSHERNWSLRSGRHVTAGLREAGLHADLVDIADDTWIPELLGKRWDVVFPVVHGWLGEDGKLQGFLDTLQIPYCGSGTSASALCINKAFAKAVASNAGLTVPIGKTIAPLKQGAPFPLDDLPNLPLVVKPSSLGSSFGLRVISAFEDLDTAIVSASEFGSVLIEEFVDGTEFTVSVLEIQPGEPDALPPIEVTVAKGIFDTNTKVNPINVDYKVRIDNEPIVVALKSAAIEAFKSLGCRGYARVDLIARRTDGVPVFLEINTNPGMTELSSFPRSARAAGYDWPTVLILILLSGLFNVPFEPPCPSEHHSMGLVNQ